MGIHLTPVVVDCCCRVRRGALARPLALGALWARLPGRLDSGRTRESGAVQGDRPTTPLTAQLLEVWIPLRVHSRVFAAF